MIVISNFYKLILIIILIIILFELIKNFNTETFQEEEVDCSTKGIISNACPLEYIIRKVEDQDKQAEDIGKNLIKLEWNITIKNTTIQKQQLKKFIIVIYINNKGPYFDYIGPTARLYECPLALKKGVNYKFAVIGIYTDTSNSDVDEELITGVSIKEITVDALNNNYNQKKLNNWIQKISCKSNGKHKIVDLDSDGNCNISRDNSIIAKHSLGDSDTNDELFSDEKHIELMKVLTNKSPSKLNVNLSHNLPPK
jgi:hypothetical protein